MLLFMSIWLTASPPKPPKPKRGAKPAIVAPPPPVVPQGLRVVIVVREGLPPYDDANRLYRLEGEGCDKLKPGEIIYLHRDKEHLTMPRLEITQVMPEYALSKIVFAGETFPLRGDLAFPRGQLKPLPAFPSLQAFRALPATPDRAKLLPATPTRTAPGWEPGILPHREPLYFLQGETRISPTGEEKLKAWVKTWGTSRRWSLACAPWPGESLDLSSARLTVLSDELRRLGIPHLEVKILPDETPGTYPVIYVQADPW